MLTTSLYMHMDTHAHPSIHEHTYVHTQGKREEEESTHTQRKRGDESHSLVMVDDLSKDGSKNIS